MQGLMRAVVGDAEGRPKVVSVSVPELQLESYQSIVSVSKALSDPIRVRMVMLLAKGRAQSGLRPVSQLPVPGRAETDGICVNEFQTIFRLGQSKVSYHLRVLREAGLVTEESRGKWSFYSLDREAFERYVDQITRYFLQ